MTETKFGTISRRSALAIGVAAASLAMVRPGFASASPKAGLAASSTEILTVANGAYVELADLWLAFMDLRGGDGAMWIGKAMTMVTAAFIPATWLRDNGGPRIDPAEVTDWFSLGRLSS